jgi:hypothetical protein
MLVDEVMKTRKDIQKEREILIKKILREQMEVYTKAIN